MDETIRPRMRAIAERLSLPLRQGLRRSSGNVAGAGAGSSIDFQDHRPYVPGDDPRHIDWQAYARSGHYTMKLYREEVRPLVDLVLDISGSMFLDEEKARRTWELAWFCLESALRSGAAVHIFSISGPDIQTHRATLGWTAFSTDRAPGEAEPPHLHHIPWRAASLRVFVSDLLFAALPETLITPMLATRGRAVILAPGCHAEAAPDWLGNTELIDCEGAARRDLRFHPEDLRHYAEAYRSHFDLWRVAARRHGAALAQVAAGGSFTDALSAEGFASGCVELA